jgi:ribosomal protein L7Ae-like RNA K-turn-binding protein
MSVKELKEALTAKKLSFGIREVLKAAKAKKLKKTSKVFVSKDVRDETVKQLETAGVEFEVLKNKNEIAQELGIDFDSEVYFIQ